MQELEKKQASVQKRRSAQIAMAGGCGKSAFIGCPNLGTRDCIACFLFYWALGTSGKESKQAVHHATGNDHSSLVCWELGGL